MKTIDILKKRLEKMTDDFNHVSKENKELKAKIEHLQSKNDLLNRKSEDLLLSINNRLRKEENSEEHNISHQ